MEWMRQRPRVAAAAGILGTVLVLVIVVLLTRTPSKPTAEPALTQTGPTATATRKPLKELPTTAATPTTAAQAAQELKKKLDTFGSTGSIDLGDATLPGLPGGTSYKYATKHHITIRVSSAEPIGTIGYYIPYSPDHQSGTVQKAGRTWSLTTVSFGDPDYARIYVSSGPNPAHPVTVSITVDGRTKSKTTEGPYALLIFQA
jgi:hypothetical protein